jgi:hypothetical protein
MHTANFREAARRAIATFIAGATATPLTVSLFDVSYLTAASIAGLVAVWNLLGRWAQFELESARQ